MNIRTAILQAADYIEGHPESFRYTSQQYPDCGTPGCALGWIGRFAEMKDSYRYIDAVARDFLLIGELDFYIRMNKLNTTIVQSWMLSAAFCAATMRLYADKYHPEPKVSHAGIPSSVRELFNQPVQA